MGNDEFILYCRKQHKGDDKSTAQLGKPIWEWIRDNANGKKVGKRENCEWGEAANNVSAGGLPYSATQFERTNSLLYMTSTPCNYSKICLTEA